MRVSLDWLQQFVDVSILGLGPDDFSRSLTMVGLAVDLYEAVGDDVVFEIDVTTNRPDCLNHFGIARELAAQYRLNLRSPDFAAPETDDSRSGNFPVKISIEEPELCPRYAGRVLTDVKIEESPAWLKRLLEAVGQRPINNVVDITNLVLFELGHPLHSFDYEKLSGRQIRVRRARQGEKLVTLDGLERVLDESMLMICDANAPVAVAGVMGGLESEISESSSTILLESAYFDPVSVRTTSKRLGLSTEASYRFERGADPRRPVDALNVASRMIVEICGGHCVSPVIDEHPLPHRPQILQLRQKRVRQVLGVQIDVDEMMDILDRLEFSPRTKDEGVIEVRVPSFRSDISLEDDLVEEVARHYGYDRIDSTYPAPNQAGAYPAGRDHLQIVEDTLVGLGFYQALNYSFSSPEREEPYVGAVRPMVAIANPLTDLDTHLRTTLIPGLIDSLKRNLNLGSRDVRLFEIGNAYAPDGDSQGTGVSESTRLAMVATGGYLDPSWHRKHEAVDFFHVKGMLETVLEGLGVEAAFRATEECAHLHPGVAARILVEGREIGTIGELHPDLARSLKLVDKAYCVELDLDPLLGIPLPTPSFQAPSRFPPVDRDLSFLLDRDVTFSKIQQVVLELGVPELRALRLMDLYHGSGLPQNKVSLTVRLTFEHPSRTLVQAEVAERCDRVVAVLREQFAIEQR